MIPLPWVFAAVAGGGALVATLVVGGVYSWQLDRCKSAASNLAAEHAALVAAANRQSAAVDELKRLSDGRVAEANKRAKAGERRAQAMDAQASALRGAQAESCEAAVAVVREGLR